MEKELKMISDLIDHAVKAGLFQDAVTVVAVRAAYIEIERELQKDEPAGQ
jgi:hypothetical protein